jgi:hypothetical protein
VLREVGLADRRAGHRLLAFNLGIEAGQAVFASTLIALIALAGGTATLAHERRRSAGGIRRRDDRELLDDRAARRVMKALGAHPTGVQQSLT